MRLPNGCGVTLQPMAERLFSWSTKKQHAL